MALIVCRHCGKKVSDTVETCIHCGGLLAEPAEQPEVTRPETTRPQDAAVKTKAEKPAVYDYFVYSEEGRIQLEEEFMASNPWAYKYRRTGVELGKFESLFGAVMWSVILGFIGLFLLYTKVFDGRAYRMDLIHIAAVGAVILSVISLLAVGVIAIVQKIRENSYDRLMYIKKYQKWLLEEKNISYKPQFEKKRLQKNLDMIQ